ncbi:MAG TPA: glycosyltransferase [Alphaproteobacteria bacterium]|nr:glycosyltransferase [Alphaproteobacteria bacterium]
MAPPAEPSRAPRRPLRLVHVHPTYLPATRYGGTVVAIHGLCRALAARGHRVEVYTTSVDGPGESPVPLDMPIELDGVTVRYFASPVLRRLYWAPALARALAREMPGADAAHLHSVYLWPTAAAARLARRAGVPYVVSPRGMLVEELIRARSRLAKSAWIALVERRNLEAAAAIHTASAHEATELARFGWRLPRVETIANGLDPIDPRAPDGSAPDLAPLAAAQPLVLFLGRLARVKRLDRLLRAFARTRAGTLALVGPDYDRIAGGLESLARELGIAARVRLVPRIVLGPEKEFVFASARALVLPSESESFGNAVLEAMQRGLPVVVTRGVGAAEIVSAAGAGSVVDAEEGALAQAIDRLLADPEAARAMGEAGRRHVRARYEWDAIAAQMERLYESLRR